MWRGRERGHEDAGGRMAVLFTERREDCSWGGQIKGIGL